nr:hypothetical protein 336p_00006 [Serratia proteamaculans]ULG15421.1 hypothetical protein 465p1_00015 [Serratia proteamaculans]ULG16515.1 hypothetical protein 1457p_00014 [Serratia proteamaculans]ULG16628.1 hypothetical protein 1769p_00010 [Serratia proteamaculans]ULG16748.1 hypothetical protein 1770p1_00010 [Serratia proteamaculans]
MSNTPGSTEWFSLSVCRTVRSDRSKVELLSAVSFFTVQRVTLISGDISC